MMTRQDFMSICITFAAGFFIGVYLFLAGFTQSFTFSLVPEAAEFEEFSITGERYGGCERGGQCAAFQVRRDGSYRYAPGSTERSDVSLSIGQVPGDLRRELMVVLTPEALSAASAEVEVTDCAAFRDGVDTRYEISLAGTRYRLDTCTTALASTDALAQTLAELWMYFETENQ